MRTTSTLISPDPPMVSKCLSMYAEHRPDARTALLDFSVPRGLHFGISKSPNPLFKTTYSMNALPSLNGSVGYIFTSCNLDVKGSGDVRFKDMVDRFKVFDRPRRPEGKEEEWLAGDRVDTRGTSVHVSLHLFRVPTCRFRLLAVWANIHTHRTIRCPLFHSHHPHAPRDGRCHL